MILNSCALHSRCLSENSFEKLNCSERKGTNVDRTSVLFFFGMIYWTSNNTKRKDSDRNICFLKINEIYSGGLHGSF